jgi:hypothetical protein
MSDTKLGQGELGHDAGLTSFLEAAARNGKDDKVPDLGKDGISSSVLRGQLTERYGLARQYLSAARIEQLMVKASSQSGPAYTERDAIARFDSNYEKLAQGEGKAAGVSVYKKSMLEGFSLHRHKDGETFNVSAFPVDKIAVTLPPGASLLLINEEGDQAGLRLPAKKQTIEGESVRVAEISRSLVQPFGSTKKNPSFSVKVLGKDGDVLFEQPMQFHAKVASFSRTVLSGSIEYPDKPKVESGELSDEHFNHFVPSPKHNPAPAGERPSLRIDGGESCDQLLIQRDGESFGVNRWAQFLYPPRGNQQAFSAEGADGKKTTYLLSAGHHRSLDDPDYESGKAARLKSSHGHPATSDRSLSQTDHFVWNFRGVSVYTAGTMKMKARFDPLSGDKNARRAG